ncbi:MAG TPA: WHG domain-containing protein [Terriglobales bacterium]|nr:WHG domain-containing protein [Terriglobales bacterium]
MAKASSEREAKKQAKEADRRQPLVAATENIIKNKGLAAVKARDIADAAGVGLGSVYYNRDLDDLILEANANTLTRLEKALGNGAKGDPATRLVAMAEAYLQFADENTLSWKALFEHKLPAGKALPEWYLGHQLRLFDKVDDALREISPELSRSQSAALARTIFSAVHGVVILGLEEKLGIVPPKSLRQQLKILISALVSGLSTGAG